jgi:DNA-binding NarL/FixJ family response regulator
MTETYSPTLVAPDRILAMELEDTARRLTLVDSEHESGFGRLTAPVSVRVYAADPISQLGIMAHLRHYREVNVVEGDEPASVAVAIADNLDEDRIRWLRSLHRDNGVSIVLIAGHIDPRTLVTAVEAGVCAVISRADVTPEKLVHVIQAASRGDAELPPQLLRHLLDQVGRLNRQVREPNGLSFAGLTKRERDVLELVAEGLSTREVADSLNYSERTIKTVLQDLTIRLHLRNRTHAVAYALRNGWI